jgi:ribosomal protein S18 acetylase RimI-like enzyme
VDIRRLGPDDVDTLEKASPLFDRTVRDDAARRFLAAQGHHIFLAYEGETPVGFVTGIEMTHPDKGTEMFLYELGVAAAFRRRGYGVALVNALVALARERHCYGMWVLTEEDNRAALATYAASGAARDRDAAMLSWHFP